MSSDSCVRRDPLPVTAVPQPTDSGIYWGALFRFKIEGDQGGVLVLLWKKDDDKCGIASWGAFGQ